MAHHQSTSCEDVERITFGALISAMLDILQLIRSWYQMINPGTIILIFLCGILGK